MQHHVIYVPGIGDDIFLVQSTIIKFWRLFGVYGHCHPMPWAGSGEYAAKAEALAAYIDKYKAAGHRVSLVGASAGASAVLNAYANRRNEVSKVIYVCAKINRPDTVSAVTIGNNPAFKEALAVLQTNVSGFTDADKSHFHSFYSEKDGLAPYEATHIRGVKETKLPPLRHGLAIIYSLSIGFPKLLRVLKQVA
jgi:pimeloyl-ACP methyl ester carboxylesterase